MILYPALMVHPDMDSSAGTVMGCSVTYKIPYTTNMTFPLNVDRVEPVL